MVNPPACCDIFRIRLRFNKLTVCNGMCPQVDREPHSHVLEASVEKLAEFLSVSVHKFNTHTLYDTQK